MNGLKYRIQVADLPISAFRVEVLPKCNDRIDAVGCKSVALVFYRSAEIHGTIRIDLTLSLTRGTTVDILLTRSQLQNFFFFRTGGEEWRKLVQAGSRKPFADSHISDVVATAFYETALAGMISLSNVPDIPKTLLEPGRSWWQQFGEHGGRDPKPTTS